MPSQVRSGEGGGGCVLPDTEGDADQGHAGDNFGSGCESESATVLAISRVAAIAFG